MAIQYENAPIQEALIDIRANVSPSVKLGQIESIHERVKGKYPGRQQRLHVEGQFSSGDEVGAVAKQTLMGYAFSSEDGKQIFQARRDGFTFSRLRPYGNWFELSTEAWRLWDIYRDTVNPEKITRVAVRYINQVNIPRPAIDYKEYFRTTPEVSPDLPQGISGFFMQLQFPQPDFQGMLILTQTAVHPRDPGPIRWSLIWTCSRMNRV